MRQNTGVTFAMRDLDRLKCIQAVVDGDLKPIRAADRLGHSTRQVRRLARRYAAAGPAGLISKRFHRPSNNRTDDALADAVIKMLRSTYADFGPTLATEKLRTHHGIDLAKETVRQLEIATGLWIPRKYRLPKVQQPRLRRACLGELVQIDGCEHPWFEDRAPVCTALVKASIFRVNHASATGGAGHTQFGRALYELNIDGICANTPAAQGRVERAHLTLQDRLVKETQYGRALHELGIEILCANTPAAKGRVERAHGTLQDRLVKEMRLEGIFSIADANAWIDGFVETYNARFSTPPSLPTDVHRLRRGRSP
jgi:winged helix-turn helix protein